jgi:hypothetical protein
MNPHDGKKVGLEENKELPVFTAGVSNFLLATWSAWRSGQLSSVPFSTRTAEGEFNDFIKNTYPGDSLRLVSEFFGAHLPLPGEFLISFYWTRLKQTQAKQPAFVITNQRLWIYTNDGDKLLAFSLGDIAKFKSSLRWSSFSVRVLFKDATRQEFQKIPCLPLRRASSNNHFVARVLERCRSGRFASWRLFAIGDGEESHCLSCGQRSLSNDRSVLCVSEVAELTAAKNGTPATAWRTTDKQGWKIPLCSKCLSLCYQDRLNADLLKAQKDFRSGLLSLALAVVFFLIAETGMLKGLAGLVKLFVALVWIGALLVGLLGTPIWLYALIKARRARSTFVLSGMIPESQANELYIKVGETILNDLQSEPAKSQAMSHPLYPLPIFRDRDAMNRRRIVAFG